MYSSALEGQNDERQLTTIELITGQWKSQYLSGHRFVPITREAFLMPETFTTLRDESLLVPITAARNPGGHPQSVQNKLLNEV